MPEQNLLCRSASAMEDNGASFARRTSYQANCYKIRLLRLCFRVHQEPIFFSSKTPFVVRILTFKAFFQVVRLLPCGRNSCRSLYPFLSIASTRIILHQFRSLSVPVYIYSLYRYTTVRSRVPLGASL